MKFVWRALRWVVWLGLLAGCGDERRASEPLALRELEPLESGQEQIDRLCSRGGSDLVLDTFCPRGEPPTIGGFRELRDALEMASNRNGPLAGFVLSGHSTSLVSRSVSAINPRMIFVRFETADQELLALAFARGETFSEIVVRDRVTEELQFYLVTFTPACERDPEGCSPGDLLTETVESGWSDVDVYAEEDLENTPRDCRVCHQPEGPGSRKLLRMQELQPPWNHWLYRLSEGGRALLDDYYAAKGDEPYAGVPSEQIVTSQPGLLAATVAASSPSYGRQPNEFDSAKIEREVRESAAQRGGDQPADNSVPGESETWQALYERAKRGEAISAPYHDVKVTDPDKLARMTQAYTDYREGALERDALPDIREVFPDDPELRARIGLSTEPGLDGEEVLRQACALCHNDRLDQSLSRARFNVDLDRLSREEKRRAIARILLPRDDPAAMPPALSRQLSEEGRERLIDLLER